MPKEVVRLHEGSVTVGWTEGQIVQLGIGQEKLFRFKGNPEEFNDLFVDLGRQDINNLIRNLRKARDRAFGRDE
jgi:hypothetical protein